MITVKQIQQLPVIHREMIPVNYFIWMEHMDIGWYTKFYANAIWIFFHYLGIGDPYYSHEQAGIVALKQFIQYLAEVREGEMVAIHGRILGRSDTQIHFMLFMVNETTHVLASNFEVLGAHLNMRTQHSSPYLLSTIPAKLDAAIAEQAALGWDAPVCGLISP